MSAQKQELQELDRISILFQLGFRPFFLGAGMIAVLFMILWTASYSFSWADSFPRMSSIHWHAHEMLYGYAMAVIAGLLLTAVCNWTGQPALQGTGLMLPFLFWLAARLASMLDLAVSPWLMLICDLGFWILLSLAVMKPILKVRQWRQSGILAKLLLLGFSNLAFYAGIMGWFADGIRWGLYGGLYLIIGLVLTMGRRVIPFFTEREVGYSVKKKLELAGPLRHRHLPFLFCLGIIVPRIRLFRPFCFGPLRDSRHSDFRMAHPGNLEKTSALELVCRLFFYDFRLFTPCWNALFRLESLPRRACLRNGRDWLDLTEHDGPGFPRS